MNFLSLGISERIADILKMYGIAAPTPIQQQAIPVVMEGRDVIAQAQTGTGKTFAFVLPILEKIDPNLDTIQALIVTPTRELALQITAEINKFIEHLYGLHVLAVYGGQDVEKQLSKLKKKIQIVVGTPGRLLDHIRRGTVDLSRVSFLVLDEADQMLHIGFLHEVEEIIGQTPASRQTMLFSATIPEEIKTLAKKHLNRPQSIQVEKTQAPALTIKQIAIATTDRGKQAELFGLINKHRPFLAVVFCRTKRRVSKLYEALKANGFSCDELHGDLSQAKRERVMESFRQAEIQLLVATDVAARGLDVDGVTHVFNYDIPQDTESYVHRIGRTGRAGSKGLAITLYTPKDKQALESIEKDLKLSIQKQKSEAANDTGGSKAEKSRDSRVRKGKDGPYQQKEDKEHVRMKGSGSVQSLKSKDKELTRGKRAGEQGKKRLSEDRQRTENRMKGNRGKSAEERLGSQQDHSSLSGRKTRQGGSVKRKDGTYSSRQKKQSKGRRK